MVNAASYQHYPLPEENENRILLRRLRISSKQATYHLLMGAQLIPPFLRFSLRSGDYDSAAWLYSSASSLWDDPTRRRRRRLCATGGSAFFSISSRGFPYDFFLHTNAQWAMIGSFTGDSGAADTSIPRCCSPPLPPADTAITLPLACRLQTQSGRIIPPIGMSDLICLLQGFIINGAAGHRVSAQVEDLYASFSPRCCIRRANRSLQSAWYARWWYAPVFKGGALSFFEKLI